MVHNGGGTDASGEVTAVDVSTMDDGDLEDAVGLLTQLEVPHPPPQAAQRSYPDHLAFVTWPCTLGMVKDLTSHALLESTQCPEA